MSGAIAGLIRSVLPGLEGGAGAGAKGGDMANSFSSMLGGLLGGSTSGAGGSSVPSGGSSGGAGAAEGSGAGGSGASGSMDQLKQSAMQDIAQQSPDLLQHYNLDIKNGDGNAAAEDLASIANQNPSLQKDVGVLGATVGTDAEPGGGGKLSDKATQDLQAAVPDARIDVGSSAINRAGDSIKNSFNSGLQNMADGLGGFVKSAETTVGKLPGLASGL